MPDQRRAGSEIHPRDGEHLVVLRHRAGDHHLHRPAHLFQLRTRIPKAIREDEIAAESMGVSLLRHKMLSFMLSAFLAAVGGGLFASYIGTIGPDVFQVSRTYDILMIVVMGGMGSISGSVLAAFIVTIGQEWLRVLDGPLPFLPFWPESGVSGMRMVVFSVLLLIIILFFRNGLFGHKEVTWSSIGKRLAALSGHGKGVKSDE